ncbi:MAG TPA: response regulator transcription factor [Usitatibacteraceae bacterium]|nr:response regulator transcription factor [Usitatibacteraceae bacterium]
MEPNLKNPDNDGPYILVVDDDETFLSVLARSLERRGYKVRTAPDHECAISIAQARLPEFAVVDLKLARSSGLRLVKQLREMAPNTRIVILTGYGSIATTIEAIKLGAVYYLTKPATADDVIAAFNREEASEEIPAAPIPPSFNRLEWEHVNRVLAETNGNISASARILGWHRRTLQRKLGKRPVER